MDLALDQTSHRSRWSLAGGLSSFGRSAIRNVVANSAALRRTRSGRIVIEKGRLDAIYGRWWPYTGNMLQVWWDIKLRRYPRDRCELYFHAPLFSSKFLTLSYIRSGPLTSLSTLYAASLVLDEIAELKEANAIVCNVTNQRISDRLMKRWGWEEHCLNWRGRHFIKRFYGEYPIIGEHWRDRLTLS